MFALRESKSITDNTRRNYSNNSFPSFSLLLPLISFSPLQKYGEKDEVEAAKRSVEERTKPYNYILHKKKNHNATFALLPSFVGSARVLRLRP